MWLYLEISYDETNHKLLELPADCLVVSNGFSDDIPHVNERLIGAVEWLTHPCCYVLQVFMLQTS